MARAGPGKLGPPVVCTCGIWGKCEGGLSTQSPGCTVRKAEVTGDEAALGSPGGQWDVDPGLGESGSY